MLVYSHPVLSEKCILGAHLGRGSPKIAQSRPISRLLDVLAPWSWSWSLTFQGQVPSSNTWPFNSLYTIEFSSPLEPNLYLQPFSRYSAPKLVRWDAHTDRDKSKSSISVRHLVFGWPWLWPWWPLNLIWTSNIKKVCHCRIRNQRKPM